MRTMEKINSIIKKAANGLSGRKFNSAIIVCAGSGTRMMTDGKTKQLLDLAGIPVIVRTILEFDRCDDINEIIIVAKGDEVNYYRQYIKDYKINKISSITTGGATRQESVLNGLKKVNDKADFIAIHDGARCLITSQMISTVCHCAYKFGAATAATKAKDTIKIADKKGFVKETADRSFVWYAQTPQMFKADIYRAAAFSAKESGFEATDDNALVEKLGFKVFLCDVGYENIKITTKEDIYIAEAILLSRKESD